MRFSGLSVRQLEAFEATMVAGSVSGAALSLNISQPSVSRLLQGLELDSGLSLFDRSHGRLVPTEQGMLFYEEVSKTFHGARKLIRAAQEIRELRRGVVRVGTLASMSFKVIPETIKVLRDSFPSARTTVAVGNSREIMSSVISRLTDVGIVDAGVSFLDAVCAWTFERNSRCIMDPSHPLVGQKAITIGDFADYPFVSLGEEYFLRSSDGARLLDVANANVVADTFQSFLACALVRGSSALAVVDPITANYYSEIGLVSKAIHLEIPYRVSILVNERSATGLASKKFIEVLRTNLNS